MAVVLEFMRQEIVKRVSDDLCLLTKQDTKDRKDRMSGNKLL
jgi:hypothetical protein